MDDALVEKVARDTWNASADTWNSWDNLSEQERSVFREAVLAGVKEGLEMAAKVARDHRASWDMPAPAIDYDQACDDIAAGIEALGPRP